MPLITLDATMSVQESLDATKSNLEYALTKNKLRIENLLMDFDGVPTVYDINMLKSIAGYCITIQVFEQLIQEGK